MKIYTKKGALAVAAAVFAITAAPVQADHDTAGAELSADGLTISLSCDTFGALQYTFDELVTFANEDKDRPSLQGKLDYAHSKLHEDPQKFCDAAQKLDDFSFKVRFLLEGRDGTGKKPKVFDEQGDVAIWCLIDGSAAIAEDLRTDDQGDSLDCTVVEDPPRGKGRKDK